MKTEPEIVLGPPGTGKTTSLLDVVDAELTSGTAPDRIAYLSFTRRAADEAATRACAKFNLERSQLPLFRTLHSLCFTQLGLQRQDILEGKRLREFAEYAGVRITGRRSEDGTMGGFDLGDRVLFMESMARACRKSVREIYNRDHDDLPWSEVDRVVRSLREFKSQQGLMDFTDMLEEFLRSGIRVRIDVLVVDEAQDLSALQWAVIWHLAKDARRVVIAGDDDQAIFVWAGADVDCLIDMSGSVSVLGQSWRVPPVLQSLAGGVIGRVARRRPKAWRPREGATGTVERAAGFEGVDCSGSDILVLARNAHVVDRVVIPELRRQGIVYQKGEHSSVKHSMLVAIQSWERLRRGERALVSEIRVAYSNMSSGRGYKRGNKELPSFDDEEMVSMQDLLERGGLLTTAVWYEAMDRVPREDVNYIRAALQRGERLSEKPRVRVSTIHGSKGGEADHVVLMKEMARRTYREMDNRPDDERRVWYVGITRARERLTVVESRTQQSCPWV